MKKILTLAFIATISLNAFSQFNQENAKEIVSEEFTSTDATYRLYPTKN